VALLRARPVFTWPASGQDPLADFAPLLEEIAYRPIDEAAVRENLLRMRGRIEVERAGQGRGSLHLRFSPGGLTDLEFLAAYGQLRSAASDPELRTASPSIALARLVARGEAGPVLLDDYRALQRASLRLRLLRDVQDDRLTPEDRPALARSLGLSEPALEADLAARTARVRAAFLATLGTPVH
jgi:glutamate-ammonia-ligase adenylyltransferase